METRGLGTVEVGDCGGEGLGERGERGARAKRARKGRHSWVSYSSGSMCEGEDRSDELMGTSKRRRGSSFP